MKPESSNDTCNFNRLRILLVEDHPATREGLRNAINSQADMAVVGEAPTWHAALDMARGIKPQVLVLDLNLPDGNGWSLLEQLRSLDILPPTLVLSVCEEAVYARRLLRAGARGYLMKDEPIEHILRAIREIHAGRLVASPALTSELMSQALNLNQTSEVLEPSHSAGLLSDRELQVISLLARDLTNKDVAANLGISEKTVHTYKARIMTKLGVRTTPELIAHYNTMPTSGGRQDRADV